MNTVKISMENGHGYFECSPGQLETAIRFYLPNSAQQLRHGLTERCDNMIDFSDVKTVGELLIILASMESDNA